jgi:creatinine amidohydrolase
MTVRSILPMVLLTLLGAATAVGQAPGAHLGDLTWPEAERRIREAPMVVVPFGGGAKEHGPHLPLATDRLMLEHLMEAAVDSLPVVVAPPILHGWFPAFEDFPGTNIPDPELFRRYVEEVARSLVRHGARRVVFLNTGITRSTGLPIATAARQIHVQEGVATLVVSWDDLETSEVEALSEQRAGGHADEAPAASRAQATDPVASHVTLRIPSTPPRASSATPRWPRRRRAGGWWRS